MSKSAAEKFQSAVKKELAKYYHDALSDVIKRGIAAKKAKKMSIWNVKKSKV
jgi:hypothetical protein